MITSETWRGKRYAVLGLARSGAATVRALLGSGAEVVAWDSDEGRRAEILPGTGRGASEAGGGALSAKVPLHHPADGPPPRAGEDLSFADPVTLDLTGFAAVVVSPGVPLNRHPIAGHAAKYGVPVIGDIELFAQARAELPPHKVVGITGTNGKSTTTALVHHILQTAGVPTTMGGNIGLPILGQEPLPAGGVYVLELSSFQIDLTFTLDCDVAVLLNVTPDHLDRYDGFEAYATSKRRLFEQMSAHNISVFTDDPESSRAYEAVSDELAANALNVSTSDRTTLLKLPSNLFGHVRIRDGWAYGPVGGPNGRLGLQKNWPNLNGPHNAQNAAAAIAVGIALKLDTKTINNALRTYPGLPHRMERVRDLNGVLFVNDSKATNADSAAPALAAYPHVRWILGGQAKTADLDACAPHFGHVRSAYTIGEAGGMFADLLRPHMPVEQSGTLAVAVEHAARDAKAGDTVLLSPACASFDQFRNFEDRGDAFRSLVEAL